MFHLSCETSEDWWEVEALYDLCFGPSREALSSYRLRYGVTPITLLSLVARDLDGILAGAIRYWPVFVGTAPALLLGPIAVHPIRQGEGLGGLLIRESLQGAPAQDWDRVLLVGDAPYYCRFGFKPLSGVVMPPPTNPKRILGLPLVANGWIGITGSVSSLRL